LTQTGSSNPRNDRVCITSSCPRQFVCLLPTAFYAAVGSKPGSLKRSPRTIRTGRPPSQIKDLIDGVHIPTKSAVALFDYLVGKDQQFRRNVDIERLCSFEINDELPLGRLQDW